MDRETAGQSLVGVAGIDPLTVQVGGTHYKGMKIQPVEYIHANNIGFCEGSAIKYLSRWRQKGGLQDLEKAKHFIDLLVEQEKKATADNRALTHPAPNSYRATHQEGGPAPTPILT